MPEQTDKWKCNRCGEEFEHPKKSRPAICPNPNCKKRESFQALTGPYTFFDGNGFVPARLARAISEKHTFATHLKSHVIYVYNGGTFVDTGEEVTGYEARERLEDLSKENYIREVIAHIEETTYTPPEDFEAPSNLINLSNGIFNIETWEFTQHTPNVLNPKGKPETIFINEVWSAYNPDADCPRIMAFLSEVLNPDDLPIIQEMIGYCLYRDYPFAKAFMMLGAGNNGKSTLLRLISTFLGVENVATPSLQDLIYDRFSKAELYGKLANIHADIPATKLSATGVFKMLTGEDLIYAQLKHKRPFTFKNYAKLIYSANELPGTDDTTEAFWRRWILITFPNTFPENDPKTDPHIIEKLVTPQELSGLLNWALAGLKHLLGQGYFSSSKTRKEIEDEWVARTDSLRAFVNQFVTYDPHSFSAKEDFYTAYLDFCDEHEVTPVEKAVVGRRLPVIFPKVSEFKPGTDKRRRAWRGVRFSEPYDKYHVIDGIDNLSSFSALQEKEYIKDKKEKTVPSVPLVSLDEGETIEKVEKPVTSVTNLKQRLFEVFGVVPFKPSQIPEHFTDDELPKLSAAMDDMKERGELMVVPLESGEYAFQLVRK